MAETDNPKNTRLLAMVIGTTASLIVVVLAIVQYFDMSVRTEVYEKVLSQPSSVLRDLRAMETDKLSRYAWVDQKAGIVRMPVDRAAELTLRDWDKRPSGLVKVEEFTPPPAPAPAPAPAAPAPGAPAATPPPATTPQPAGGTPTPGTPQAPAAAPTPAPSTQPTGAAPSPTPAATPAATPGTAPPAQPPKP